MAASTTPAGEQRRRMRAPRKRVADHDVQRWATLYLQSLASAPVRPHRPTRANDQELRDVERANRANLRASEKASEGIPDRTSKRALRAYL